MRQLKVVSIVPLNVKANHKLLIDGVKFVVRSLEGGVERNIVALNVLGLPTVGNIAESIQRRVSLKHITKRIKTLCCIKLFFVEADMVMQLIWKRLLNVINTVVKYAGELLDQGKRVLIISFLYARVANMKQIICNWCISDVILGGVRVGCQRKLVFVNFEGILICVRK